MPPKRVTPENAYFVLRPVETRSAPPCREDAVPEVSGGREVACYRLGPVLVAADDVATAVAREDRASGTWQVEFTLTPAGTARFRDLFRAVGAGGQIAVVVDDRVVSAPRVADPGGATSKGPVTGLDEQTARSLADRLRS